MDYEEPCLVTTKCPGPDTWTPEYGTLAEKRWKQKANRVKTNMGAYETKMAAKRDRCHASPLDKGCIPPQILLPERKLPEEAGRFLEADAPEKRRGNAQFLKNVRVKKEKVDYPGWLVELTNPQLQSVVDARDLLANGKNLCDLIGPFYQAILGLESGITEEEVKQILMRTPYTSRGPSFSHFMFIAGNPHLAKKKGVLQDPFLSQNLDLCPQPPADDGEEEEEEEEDAPKKKKKPEKKESKAKTRKEVVDRLYKLPKIEKDNWPPKEDKQAGGDDGSEFSLREKLFYSGLLYCEMYDTMQQIDKIYKEGANLPETSERTLKREQQTGFGISSIGTKKLGFAEWDRPLPPLPKTSPYITDFPLVGTRKKIIKPSAKTFMYRRSAVGNDPVFLSIRAPNSSLLQGNKIKVTANASRVKGILELLASQGNCLALLPGVESIFNLSDTLLQKMEDVRPRPIYKPSPLYRGNENLWIGKQAKHLFRPHGLPPQIARIPPLITFSDGIKLREICRQVREQHWSYITLKKQQFRETVWPMMHVERIPCGNLRESFLYSFQTLLPVKSHLPIIREDPLPW